MASQGEPYRPYMESHRAPKGAGDSRPSSLQVLQDCNAIGKFKGKTVLTTGCTSGIGVETARAMYEAGASVFMTGRDMSKLDSIIDDIVTNAKHNKDGPRPQGLEIHLDSLDSVRKGAEEFRGKSGGKLNVLINNAGVMASPYSTTKDGIESQIAVNHFGHFLLFQLLKPCLLASAKDSGTTSRVVNVTSAAHHYSGIKFSNKAELDAWNRREGYQKWEAYGQAKTANIYIANSITRRYGSQNLLAWSVHPGVIMTKLTRHMTQEDFEGFGDWGDIEPTLKTPSQGAATTVWAAVSPHFEGQNGGKYLQDTGETVQTPGDVLAGPSELAYDQTKEENLWRISCEVVGLQDDGKGN